jgi:uncharacterized protein (TIGR02646 family)
MIPVRRAPEPANFDAEVRQPGNAWLRNNPNAKPSKFEPYWTKCIRDLALAYNHICAYLAIYIHRPLGADSVDHFIPKSNSTIGRQKTYEWDNYRLCCIGENRKKNKKILPIDPFTMQPESFFIDFSDGRIYVNPSILPKSYRKDCDKTIKILKLDEQDCRDMRKGYFDLYAHGHVDPVYMQSRAPFVWQEICRQGLQ